MELFSDICCVHMCLYFCSADVLLLSILPIQTTLVWCWADAEVDLEQMNCKVLQWFKISKKRGRLLYVCVTSAVHFSAGVLTFCKSPVQIDVNNRTIKIYLTRRLTLSNKTRVSANTVRHALHTTQLTYTLRLISVTNIRTFIMSRGCFSFDLFTDLWRGNFSFCYLTL